AIRSLLQQRFLVTVVEALEEAIGCRAEALPDGFRAALAHRADGLPLGLQLLQFGSSGLPVGRLGQLFGARAQRLLAGEVLGPHRLARRQVVAAAREERV